MMRLLLSLLLLLPVAAQAIHMEEPLADPALEAKAEALFHELRCVTCDSQSIYESRAPLAGDMRRTVRKQLAEGMQPQAIKDYMHSRYGDSILLTPPSAGIHQSLWLAPFLLLGAGIMIVAGIAWQRKKMNEGQGNSHG